MSLEILQMDMHGAAACVSSVWCSTMFLGCFSKLEQVEWTIWAGFYVRMYKINTCSEDPRASGVVGHHCQRALVLHEKNMRHLRHRFQPSCYKCPLLFPCKLWVCCTHVGLLKSTSKFTSGFPSPRMPFICLWIWTAPLSLSLLWSPSPKLLCIN